MVHQLEYHDTKPLILLRKKTSGITSLAQLRQKLLSPP